MVNPAINSSCNAVNSVAHQLSIYKIRMGIEIDFLPNVDWSNFKKPKFNYLQEVIKINEFNRNGKEYQRYRIVATQIVPPFDFDEPPTWLYGLKRTNYKNKLSVGDIDWCSEDEICASSEEALIGDMEF